MRGSSYFQYIIRYNIISFIKPRMQTSTELAE